MAESEMSLELDFEIEDFEEENEGESLSSTVEQKVTLMTVNWEN